MFLLSERYRLELHWDKIERPGKGLMLVKGAYFSGPALANAEKINDNDHITLDFCSQMIILVKNVYTAQLSWGQVKYNPDKTVSLGNARLTYDPKVKNIPNPKDSDYIVIDTKGHENMEHAYNLLYNAYVIDETNDMYNYRS